MIHSFRPGTDDDQFVIPEIVEQDMYRMPELAKRLGGRSGTILDGGAHIGATAVMFARHFSEAKIIAYEPEPANFALLKSNAAEYSNIHPLNAALGIAGEHRLSLWPQSGTGRYSAEPISRGEDSFDVEAMPLEEEIARNTPILILKLDVEGYEAKLLNSLTPQRLADVAALILEEHPWTGDSVDVARLQRAGFEILFHPYDDPRHSVYISQQK